MIAANGGGADQDGVTAGPYGVDSVEVSCVGQRQRSSTPRWRCIRRSTWRSSARCRDAQPRPSSGRAPAGTRSARALGPPAGVGQRCRGDAQPAGDEQRSPRRDGSERQDGVHGGRRHALGGAETGGGERPGGHALARAPAADVGRHRRREQHQHGQRQQQDERMRSLRRYAPPGAAWPRGRRPPRRTPARCPARPAGPADRRGCRWRRRGRLAPLGRFRAAVDHSTAARRRVRRRVTPATTSGSQAGTRDGSSSSTTSPSHQVHELPGGPLPGDRSQAAADIADRAAVAYGSIDVTEHATGDHGVEELRLVVRRGRAAQRRRQRPGRGRRAANARPRTRW